MKKKGEQPPRLVGKKYVYKDYLEIAFEKGEIDKERRDHPGQLIFHHAARGKKKSAYKKKPVNNNSF